MDYKYKDLFLQDSTKKELYISFDNGLITNEELHSNHFELTESICSENELRFGSCESSVVRFKISNVYNSLKNKNINVSMVLNGHNDEPFIFGQYKVHSDVPTADRSFREVTAYDKMFDIINSDVAEWYNNLKFPITMREFRASFVSCFGLEEVETELINDDMIIEKTIETAELSGKVVANAICELNGCFGHISRDNKFEYIRLYSVSTLYPAVDLYPSEGDYPRDGVGATEISRSHYISCQFEDFETAWISAIVVMEDDGEIGASVGTGKNPYIIEDNFLLYGKNSDDIQNILANLLSVATVARYRPCSINAKGNPTISVGDSIKLNTKNQILFTYVLSRTLSGIQSLKDTISAEGVYEYEKNVNSLSGDVLKLKSKTNKIFRTVEETRLEIEDLEKGLKSTISQTEKSLEIKIEEAKKEATNHLSYDADNGLLVGEKSSGEWIGFVAQIMSGAFNVLNASGEILASFGSTIIELGRNTKNAVIRFCGGLGEIYYGVSSRFSKVEGLNIKSDIVRIMGDNSSSLYNSYVEDYREEGGTLQGGDSFVSVSRDNIQIQSTFSDNCLELDDVILPIGGMDSAIFVDPYHITLDSDRVDIYGDNGVYINNILISDSIQAMNALLGYGGDEDE